MVIYNLTLMDWNNEYHWEMQLIQELLQHYEEHNNLHISLQGDGLDIEASGLSAVLNIVCSLLNASNATIYNANLLKSGTIFNDRYAYSNFSNRCRYDYDARKDIQNTFCMFAGRPTWDRLALSSFLYSNTTNTIQSFHGSTGLYPDFTGTIDISIGVEFDQLCKRALPNFNTNEVLEFLKHVPMQIDNQVSGQYTSDHPLLLEKEYESSFIEVVAETAKVGTVFFPTEKTFRPMLFRTPFIVYGPVNYLKNLRKFGFKTFDKWFNEDYDSIEDDNRRLMSVIDSIKQLEELDIETVRAMYDEMNETVDHNYWTMMNLRKEDFNRERFYEQR